MYNWHRGFDPENPRYSDRGYIQDELERAPFWARERLIAKYSSEYMRIALSVGSQQARTECNTRLRVAINGIGKAELPGQK